MNENLIEISACIQQRLEAIRYIFANVHAEVYYASDEGLAVERKMTHLLRCLHSKHPQATASRPIAAATVPGVRLKKKNNMPLITLTLVIYFLLFGILSIMELLSHFLDPVQGYNVPRSPSTLEYHAKANPDLVSVTVINRYCISNASIRYNYVLFSHELCACAV